MKVLLLNLPFKFKISRSSRWPEHTKSGTLYYPFWLAYATGVLMQTKHKAILIDAIAREWNFFETIEEIVKLKPDLLVIETCTPTIKSDIAFVEQLKKVFDTKVVLTGPHVSALPEETLRMSESIDFIARKEYDYTIPDLANALERKKHLKKVLGISYRKGKKIIHNPDRPLIKNLDALPFVSKVYKKFLNVRVYRYALARHPMIQIWSSRGCPNRCTFCVLPQTFMSHLFRSRSPGNFVDELEWISKNLPEIKEVFIEDDTFTIDKERVLRICDLIEERNLNIVWSVNTRADVPFKVLKRMKETGCRMLIVGYESGNKKILDNIKKGITLERAKKFTEDAKKAGLKIFGCFMIGLPGDNEQTVEETFQFAKKLNPDMAFFQQAVPFPGTEFYNWVKEKNYLKAKDWDEWLDENGQLDSIVSYPNLTKKEIEKLRDKFAVKFNLSLKHIIEQFVKNLNWEEQKRLFTLGKDYISYLIKRKLKK